MADDLGILSEIDESLRVEKLEHFWRDHGNKVLIACVVIIAVAVAVVIWKQHMRNEHKAQTDVLMTAMNFAEEQKYMDAANTLQELAGGNSRLAHLAAVHRAQALVSAGKQEEATKIYAALAEDSRGKQGLVEQYAALQAGLLTSKKQDTADNVYAPLLDELSAVKLIKEGKQAEARTVLDKLAVNPSLPPSQRQRVAELVSSLESPK